MDRSHLLASVIGGVVGGAAGLGVRGWLIILDRREVPVQEQRTRLFTFLRWATAVLAIITVIGSAIIAYNASERTREIAEVETERSHCVNAVVLSIVAAASERTALSEELTRAEAERLRAQLAFLQDTRSEGLGGESGQTTYDAYIEALEVQLALEMRQAVTQRANQYPSVERIQECL
jgi:hypothetical protein